MKRLLLGLLLTFTIVIFAHAKGVMMIGGSPEAPVVPSCDTETTPDDMKTNSWTFFWVGEASNNRHVASRFVADANTGTVCKVCLLLKKKDNPTMNFSVQIWGDTDGRPNSADVKADYGTMNAADIQGSMNDCFDGGSAALVNGTAYHIVMVMASTDTSNYVHWYRDANCTTEVVARSSNGSTWADITTTECGAASLYKQ